jgi:hypothetical protein
VGRQRSALRRLGDLSPQGIACRPGPDLCLAGHELVRPAHPALRRRRHDLGGGREPVRLRRRPRHAPLVRARVWHLEPSPADPDTVYAGVEDAALFRSTDGGRTWQELPGLRCHESAPTWQPGAGGLCLHTILLDPVVPGRLFAAISSAGTFRTDDGGRTWRPINRGLRSEQIPNPTAEVGHCVHRIAMHPARPRVLFMQKHWDVMRSDDAGDTW